MLTKPPITSADIPDEWIANCREAMSQHHGVPIRANPISPVIDVWSNNSQGWHPLMLPGSGTTFTTEGERDLVLRRLEGK